MTADGFRRLRVTLLLLVFVFVGLTAWLTKLRATDWDQSLWVVIYPINGYQSPKTAEYITSLEVDTFRDIDAFMRDQAAVFNLALKKPVVTKLAPQVSERPPVPPFGGNSLEVICWSLQLRRWASAVDTFTGPTPDVRIFVVYFDSDTNPVLAHSLGLEQGLIGVVNAFARDTQSRMNNVIIGHELLHTVGATDKYSPATNQPVFPEGYAEPDSDPLLPQQLAEVMGGRIPLSELQAAIPTSLEAVKIGRQTAREINWIP